MTPGRNRNQIAVALYVNAGLLAAILVVLLTRGSAPGLTPAAFGQVQPPIAGGGGIFVMPAQFHQSTWGCYLLDVDAQTLCTYEYQAGERVLKLTSARGFRYDHMLKNFATTPAPWEVQHLVEMEKQDQQARKAPAPAPSRRLRGDEA